MTLGVAIFLHMRKRKDSQTPFVATLEHQKMRPDWSISFNCQMIERCFARHFIMFLGKQNSGKMYMPKNVRLLKKFQIGILQLCPLACLFNPFILLCCCLFRDTLVANDLDQANRVAFGKQRYRVVSLNGDLIETSGAMSGGGSQKMQGKMGTQVKLIFFLILITVN